MVPGQPMHGGEIRINLILFMILIYDVLPGTPGICTDVGPRILERSFLWQRHSRQLNQYLPAYPGYYARVTIDIRLELYYPAKHHTRNAKR